MEIDKTIVTHAARLCSQSYDREPPRTKDQFVLVRQFRGTGELFGFVELDGKKENAYVVFRGTNSKGNWGLTNFQAYRTKFRILDDELKVPERIDKQGGTFGFPVAGEVHQGFYRALSWLWYGTEPVFEIQSDVSEPYKTRILRQAVLIGLPLAIGSIFTWFRHQRDFVYMGAICGLLCVLLIIEIERGTFEGLWRRKPEAGPKPLSRWQEELATHENVWFVGHSLGAAGCCFGILALPMLVPRNGTRGQRQSNYVWLPTRRKPILP